MIGYEGIDVNGVRLHPAVIANHTKLLHYYTIVKEAARSYLIEGAVAAAKRYESYIEPGLFFVNALTNEDSTVKEACYNVLTICGVSDWESRFTPDDLVRVFLGTEDEPSIIDKLNYPVKAQQAKQVLETGISFEFQALLTCMFLTEHGEFGVAKEMIESLTPEQLDVLVTAKTYLATKQDSKGTTTKQLAEMAGVSEDAASKVMNLIKK